MEEKILIIDFGSQYTQLIARKVRELNVYCEIYPYNDLPGKDPAVKGVILSGGPSSVLDRNAPRLYPEKVFSAYPVLGICYGAQLMAYHSGGKIEASNSREYGRAFLSKVNSEDPLLKGLHNESQVWMSHGDSILKLPANYQILASTESVDVAVIKSEKLPFYGLQFHPEVSHTVEGKEIMRNFLVDICGCHQTWTPANFAAQTVEKLKETLNGEKVVMGLSGGVDSTVAATLIHKAIGSNLHCIFVDNGLLRKNEFREVLDSYQYLGLNIRGVDAKQRFWSALKGVSKPEEKRKIIGGCFIDIFDEEARNIKKELPGKESIQWLGQGTIYPDIIESKNVKGPSATIKSHHNVGGLPEKMNLRVVEPLNSLFKDEVRKVGKELKVPGNILNRHPFPGPGLAVRILGDITPEKVRILQEADHIFISSLKQEQLYDRVWQAGAILLPIQSVGVMGDERTYEQVAALRAVGSTDGMTADWVHLPYNFLAKVSNNIINNIKGINRVVYDISSKPPSTIEWE